MSEDFDFPKSGIHKQVHDIIVKTESLKGKKVLDCPAGDGRTSYILKKQGAEVVSGDLFPEFFKLKDQSCVELDLNQKLPFADNEFDFIVSQEGIEHLQDQLYVLQEFARVLKKNGTLLLTTPSVSHLRAKFSNLLVESEYFKRSAPSEMDGVWFSSKNKDELYFGHVFMLNLQKLRTLSIFSGFDLVKIYPSQYGSTSILLFPIFYPLIVIANLIPFFSYSRKLKNISKTVRHKIMWDQFKMNCSPQVLLSKHTVVLLQKKRNKEETVGYLKSIQRTGDKDSVHSV